MTDHLASVTEAAARLRQAVLALSAAPAGDLLEAHLHIEEVILCVARHGENLARERAQAATRASHDRLTQLRRDSLKAETASPRAFRPGVPVRVVPEPVAPAAYAPLSHSAVIVPLPIAGGDHA